MVEKLEIRFIRTNDAVYLRCEDVGQYLQEIAATEDSDTRERLLVAADRLVSVATGGPESNP